MAMPASSLLPPQTSENTSIARKNLQTYSAQVYKQPITKGGPPRAHPSPTERSRAVSESSGPLQEANSFSRPPPSWFAPLTHARAQLAGESGPLARVAQKPLHHD